MMFIIIVIEKIPMAKNLLRLSKGLNVEDMSIDSEAIFIGEYGYILAEKKKGIKNLDIKPPKTKKEKKVKT